MADPATWPVPERTSATDTTRYGTAQAHAWHRCHARLEHRGPWREHPGQLPIIDGTLIRLQVDHPPGDRAPETAVAVDQRPGRSRDRRRPGTWQAFLRRFVLEYSIRFLQQTLGWVSPKLRDPAAADRWTWLVIAAHTQLRLAEPASRP